MNFPLKPPFIRDFPWLCQITRWYFWLFGVKIPQPPGWRILPVSLETDWRLVAPCGPALSSTTEWQREQQLPFGPQCWRCLLNHLWRDRRQIMLSWIYGFIWLVERRQIERRVEAAEAERYHFGCACWASCSLLILLKSHGTKLFKLLEAHHATGTKNNAGSSVLREALEAKVFSTTSGISGCSIYSWREWGESWGHRIVVRKNTATTIAFCAAARMWWSRSRA